MEKDTEEVPIPPELQAEFDEWERMSNETMARLDAEEDLGWRTSPPATVAEARTCG